MLQTIIPSIGISCSPSSVYKILDTHFVVCTNKTTNYVSVFEVQLNASSLSSTDLTYPTNQLLIPSFVGNIENASNFVHIELDRNHEYIIFAVGTVIYSMRPFLYAAGPFGNGVPSATCERVGSLVHKGGSELYAYCSEHLFTYDIGEENWLVQDTFARRGLPYQCPEEETGLSVFADYIQYNLDGLVENVEIQGNSYSSGVCFGNTTQSYFAFRDKSRGVFSLTLQTSETVSVSAQACQDECYPLTVINSRYLIVREDASRKVLVLDFLGERQRLIEALHARAELATVVLLECPVRAEPVYPVTSMEVTTSDHSTTLEPVETNSTAVTKAEMTVSKHPKDEKTRIVKEVVIPVAVILVALMLGALAIGLLVALICYYKLREKPKPG
jgi:hypothetical protein